jgi:hypothetical protein
MSVFDDGSGGVIVCGNWYEAQEAEDLYNDGVAFPNDEDNQEVNEDEANVSSK